VTVVVEAPRFAAFYARRWGGQGYPDGALFTLQSLDDQPLVSSRQVRVFHGFGPGHHSASMILRTQEVLAGRKNDREAFNHVVAASGEFSRRQRCLTRPRSGRFA